MLKRDKLLLLLLVMCIYFSACISEKSISSSNVDSETVISSIDIIESEVSMNNDNLPSFSEMPDSPETTEEHQVNDITKIIFYEFSDFQRLKEIAIDIENRLMYTSPDTTRTIWPAPNYFMTIEESEEVLSILERYDVFSWERVQRDDTEGFGNYSWTLYIQYSDGSISIHGGRAGIQLKYNQNTSMSS